MSRLIDADGLQKNIEDQYAKTEKSISSVIIGYRGGLQEAIAYVQNAPTVAAAPRWISVDEEYPEPLKEVVVLTDTGTITKAWYSVISCTFMSDMHDICREAVMYWLPLPELPDGE